MGEEPVPIYTYLKKKKKKKKNLSSPNSNLSEQLISQGSNHNDDGLTNKKQ